MRSRPCFTEACVGQNSTSPCLNRCFSKKKSLATGLRTEKKWLIIMFWKLLGSERRVQEALDQSTGYDISPDFVARMPANSDIASGFTAGGEATPSERQVPTLLLLPLNGK